METNLGQTENKKDLRRAATDWKCNFTKTFTFFSQYYIKYFWYTKKIYYFELTVTHNPDVTFSYE